MPKKKKYTPLDDVLSVDTALLQASSLLDIAAVRAVANDDIVGMKKVAHSWVELGAVIHQLSQPVVEEEETEEHTVVSETELAVGFVASLEEEYDEEVEGPEVETEVPFEIGFRGNV